MGVNGRINKPKTADAIGSEISIKKASRKSILKAIILVKYRANTS